MGRIVIAEDDPDIRRLITTTLTRAGHEVTATPNGIGALAAIRGGQPDAVVLDLQMPGLGGLEVLRRVRADPRTAPLPILMATARCEPTYVAESLAGGATDFLPKPFSPTELAARVSQLLAAPAGSGRPPA